MKAQYKTAISDARWTAYDIPGNITSFSRPTIYNYLETKEEIFMALFQREYDRWNEDLHVWSTGDQKIGEK